MIQDMQVHSIRVLIRNSGYSYPWRSVLLKEEGEIFNFVPVEGSSEQEMEEFISGELFRSGVRGGICSFWWGNNAPKHAEKLTYGLALAATRYDSGDYTSQLHWLMLKGKLTEPATVHMSGAEYTHYNPKISQLPGADFVACVAKSGVKKMQSRLAKTKGDDMQTVINGMLNFKDLPAEMEWLGLEGVATQVVPYQRYNRYGHPMAPAIRVGLPDKSSLVFDGTDCSTLSPEGDERLAWSLRKGFEPSRN
ncbi:MAG: hypothetical protein H6922_05450 [Pseudomonadaceae bacterium]|nr:hypothetical protein [Pseudomonadaceae bacterium]